MNVHTDQNWPPYAFNHCVYAMSKDISQNRVRIHVRTSERAHSETVKCVRINENFKRTINKHRIDFPIFFF